ncbi:MAG: TadE/TadG family type IV pilus assembly protein [Acidimicrobiales bacterium]
MATWPRLTGDHGAALVEFALAAPLLILLTTGMVEYGFAWRQENLLQRALSTAGRTASSMGDNRFADYETLQSLASAMNGGRRVSIERLVVYKSTTANGQLPANCDIAVSPTAIEVNGRPGSCNVYTGAMVNTLNPVGFPAGSATNPTCASGSWDANWCPTTRSKDAPDFVGLHLRVRYTTLTGIAGSSITMDEYVVYALEPPTVGG